MENLKEYLPLLVILVLSLVSQAFKPKKKKPETTPAPKVENNEPDVWFEPVSVPKPASQVVIPPKPKISQTKTIKPSSLSILVQDSILEEETVIDDPFLNVADSEEIRKAIVYSEILHRKY
ncbi:MAG: hypothetical protein LBJ17_00530 [Dysgonamonadaceae bacterium]|jgi:hypothetical protein|nr:hypothetical protein [Dysgonamonadaceae bacterium]